MLDHQLTQYIMSYLTSKHSDIMNTVPWTQEKLSELLNKTGFNSRIVQGCMDSIAPLSDKFGQDLVEACLLMDRMERVVQAMVEVQVDGYSEKRREYLRQKPDSDEDEGFSTDKTEWSKLSSRRQTLRPLQVSKQPKTAAKKSNSAPQKIPTGDKMQDDENDSDTDNDTTSSKATSETLIVSTGPRWRPQLHDLAKENSVSIRFINDTTVPLHNVQWLKPIITKRSFYHYSKVRGQARIYHGCRVKDDLYDIESQLESFITLGASLIHAKPRGYLSSGRAVYYSNSPDYAYAWPTILYGFAQWSELARIPRDPVLIVAQTIDIMPTLNDMDYRTWIIEQNRADLAKTVFS